MRADSLVGEAREVLVKARLARVHLFVRNLERARHFYTATLGLRVVQEQPGACFLASGAGSHEIGLFEHAPAGVEPPLALGCRSIAFEVPSRHAILAVCDRLLGARFSVVESDGAWAIHTTDPDGNRIEIFSIAGGGRSREREGRPRTLSLAELRAARDTEVA